MTRTAHESSHTAGIRAAIAVEPLPTATAAGLVALAPPAPALLGPIAPGSITLIRGARGVGKSWLALALARAVAGGTPVLGWTARPAPVLYIEAAMAEAAMGQRLRALGPAPAGLRLSCAALLELGNLEDDGRLRRALQPGTLLVLDGLSLLATSGRGSRWRQIWDWLRDLREEGHAILLVEHGRRPLIEDLADTVLALKPQASAEADVAFTVQATSRHALTRPDRAFAVELALPETGARWHRSAAIDPQVQAAADQAVLGRNVREGAAALGLSPATYWRRLQEAKAQGLVTDKPRETSETETAPAPAQPRETNETAPARVKPRETDETGAVLAKVSTEVLQRTLEKRLAARQRGETPLVRPGPAILVAVPDAALLDALLRRRPDYAPRLQARFAPLVAPLPQAA